MRHTDVGRGLAGVCAMRIAGFELRYVESQDKLQRAGVEHCSIYYFSSLDSLRVPCRVPSL